MVLIGQNTVLDSHRNRLVHRSFLARTTATPPDSLCDQVSNQKLTEPEGITEAACVDMGQSKDKNVLDQSLDTSLQLRRSSRIKKTVQRYGLSEEVLCIC